MRQLLVHSSSAAQTEALGRALGAAAFPGCVIALTGPLGAGKTVMAQGVARGLGVEEIVASPTFVYIRIHRGRLTFYHVDLYQIRRPEETESLGLDEVLSSDGVVAIEWADHAARWLPDERLDVKIEFADSHRTVALSASDPGHAALIAAAAGE
jgi:tRNA threonylcarbamoyladenosine biosynthesis protein TsaE